MTNRISRLAPSPTGALHLGNARTFLLNWALARQRGWRLLLRMEDLDGPRIKTTASANTLATLRWLGLDHDGPVLHQSHDLEPYRVAMRDLARGGHIFACSLTRAQIKKAASAPHADEHELRFSPHLRPPELETPELETPELETPELKTPELETPELKTPAAEGEKTVTCCFEPGEPGEPGGKNYRFLVPDQSITIADVVAGPSVHHPLAEVGDFVVWSKKGSPAYQLAVVVDDARQGVTDVVRGDDLLSSAARQTLIYQALGLPPPRWWHLPLVLGSDGHRLAKRHGDTQLETYRAEGVAPERIIGLLGFWSGVTTVRCPLSRDEFLDSFQLENLPRSPITMTQEDDQWLRDH